MIKIVQLGLVTLDLPGTLRLYSEGFGFNNAGATCLWGGMSEKITRIRSDSRNVIWWLVGQRKFFQFEIFSYTCPVSQPLPTDWRPSDHGWTRFGVIVSDFEASLAGLKSNGVEPLTPPIEKAGRRHAAIRDPYMGAIIEVMESGKKKPEGPFVAYATNSVADLEKSRKFYRDVLQAEILPLEQLHGPSDEALWGLPGAERDGFLARVDDMLFEVVQYRNPVGRPKPAGYQISDQGIMNAAFASHQTKPIEQLIERLTAAGHVPPYVYNDGRIIAAYTIDPDCVLEYGCVPEEMLPIYGFVAAPFDFMGGGVALRKPAV
jgi:catechol 2,3-dioxygenase-like lactoylglutathione lyase family enzyme